MPSEPSNTPVAQALSYYIAMWKSSKGILTRAQCAGIVAAGREVRLCTTKCGSFESQVDDPGSKGGWVGRAASFAALGD